MEAQLLRELIEAVKDLTIVTSFIAAGFVFLMQIFFVYKLHTFQSENFKTIALITGWVGATICFAVAAGIGISYFTIQFD